jgi:hypothetical protein
MDAQDRPGWNPPVVPYVEPASPDTPDIVASSGPRRSRIGTGIAIAAIGIGALGVAGTAYASSSSPSPSPSDAANQPRYGASGATGPQGARPGMPGGGFGGDRDGGHGMRGPGMGMGLGMAVHGTFVTPKQGGGYQTVDTQQGTVTGVSSTSITVKSVDGFSQTYSVDADTRVNAKRDGIGSIKAGDEVAVMAIENGNDHKAVQIVDRTQIGGMHGKSGQQPGGSGTSAPNPTSTA